MHKHTVAEMGAFQTFIRNGDIASLKRWKEKDLLPDLMVADTGFEELRESLPHELAARYGQLETLKWLVNESGQEVRIFDRNAALIQAATFEHVDIVKWMIWESGQEGEIDLQPGDDWHTFDPEIKELIEAVDFMQKSHISMSLIRQQPELLQHAHTASRANTMKHSRKF